MPVYIIFGVSGSGKTTTGQMLAGQLGLPFHDADEYHPQSNIDKMAGGIALDDADRQPWLETLAAEIERWSGQGGAVLACSALKERYRKLLGSKTASIQWILLDGDQNLVGDRLARRSGHFFKPNLLTSQFRDLEIPDYAIRISIAGTPEQILEQIMIRLEKGRSGFGLIGLGAMGKGLALNLAGHGIGLSVFNRHVAGSEENVARNFAGNHPEFTIRGFDDLNAFIGSLPRPRNILLMVNAGKPMDAVLEQVTPMLEAGDLLIDGGNSHYEDTERRAAALAQRNIHYLGCGISGGIDGARQGVSIMAGGSREAYDRVESVLQRIAAQDRQGRPCCLYTGPGGSGHYVKMVHNGIEYAEMQLIAELYQLLRFHAGADCKQIADLFAHWKQYKLDSYLLGITIDILRKREGEGYLIDSILDAAAQNATGGWSTVTAIEAGLPFDSVAAAVMARNLSSRKSDRILAQQLYRSGGRKSAETWSSLATSLRNAFEVARIVNHAIGFDLIRHASAANKWSLSLAELARIWTGGCIIRSELMEELVAPLAADPVRPLLLNTDVAHRLRPLVDDLVHSVATGLQASCALPVLSACANYLNGLMEGQSPANLIQAQRDYFGAHTYRRVDAPADRPFHTDWKQN